MVNQPTENFRLETDLAKVLYRPPARTVLSPCEDLCLPLPTRTDGLLDGHKPFVVNTLLGRHGMSQTISVGLLYVRL